MLRALMIPWIDDLMRIDAYVFMGRIFVCVSVSEIDKNIEIKMDPNTFVVVFYQWPRDLCQFEWATTAYFESHQRTNTSDDNDDDDDGNETAYYIGVGDHAHKYQCHDIRK